MTHRLAIRLPWCFVFLVAAALPLRAASFTAAQNGNWSSSSTWGGAGIPGAGDSATVGSRTVTVDVPVTVGSVTLSGGTINGTQSLTVTSAFAWNGGTLSGSGTVSVPGGATLTVGGGGFLDGRNLSVGGTATFTGGNYFYMQNNATVTSTGLIDFLADGSGIYQNGAVGSSSVTTSGTVRKSGGTGYSYIQLPLVAQSGAQILGQSGAIQIYGATATGATFDSTGGGFFFNSSDVRTFDAATSFTGNGIVTFNTGTNTLSGTYNVTGETRNNSATTTIASPTAVGDVTVAGGTLTLNGASAINVHTLTMTGGTLTGTLPINLTGTSMTWSGGLISGSGAFTIPAVCTLTVNSIFLDGRTVTNSGTILLTTGTMYLENNAVLTNAGTITYQGDANIYLNSAVGTTAVVNQGTIQKIAGTSGSSLDVPLTAQSGSQLSVTTGPFYLHNVASTGAAFSVSGGATLYFYYTATSSFDAASTISGAGNVQWGNGTNVVSGNYNVTGTTTQSGGTSTTLSNIGGIGNVTVTSGTLTLNAASALAIPTLTMGGGILSGTAPINLTSPSMTWSGGTISGSGALSVPNGTAIAVNGIFIDGRPLSNAGTLNFTTGTMYLQNGAVLTNSGTIDFQGDGNLYLNGGAASVVNSGTIRKSSGTNGSSLGVALTAQSGSQVQALSGPLYLSAVTSTGATFSVSSGAQLVFYTGDARTFDAATTIGGAGTVIWNGGTNTVNASYSVSGLTKCTGATATLSNITNTGSVFVSGGTLALNSASALTVPSLVLQGGVLSGTAPINVTNAAMTWTGGALAGTGTFSIPNGTTLSISGSVFIDTRTVTNAGTILFPAGYTLYFQNNAVLTNNGLVDLAGDANIYLNSAAGSTVINNNGTIRKSAGPTGSTIQVAISAGSGSQLLVQSSILYLGAVTATGATISVNNTCSLYFYYNEVRSFDAATTISGAGTVYWSSGTNTVGASYNVTGSTRAGGGTSTLSNIVSLGDVVSIGGTLTLNSASAISIPTLQMQGGTVNGTAPLSITGASMTWTSGAIGGSGALTIPNGTAVTITSYVYFDARPVSNAGTLSLQNTSAIYMQNNAVLTNSGTLDLLGDGNVYLNSAVGSTAIVSSGLIRKSGGPNGSSINVPLTLQGGTFQLNSSIAYLGNVTSTGGTITAAGGTTAILYYTTAASFDAASTVSGAGTFQVQAGTTTFSGTLSTNLTMAGGTLTLNSAAAQSVPVLTMSSGTLSGTASVNVTAAAMTWTGGTVGGSGALSIPSGTTLQISGNPFFDARPVTNAGTIQVNSSYYFYMQNNAVLTNNGTIDFLTDGSVYLNSTPGSTALVNNGTIRKSAGAASQITVPLTVNGGGQLLVQAGTFYLGAVTSSGGAFSIAGGATLALYYSNTRTFDAASTISGAGTLSVQNGTNTFSGTITAPVTLSSGTFTVNSAAAQTIPTLTMSGGTLSGTATINLTGAAMTWSAGTLGGSGTLSIPAGTVVTLGGYLYFDNRQITNAGTMNFPSTYYTYMQNNAVLSNSGTVDFQGDNALYISGSPGTTALSNSGTIRKSGGTGNSYLTVPLHALSGSQFQVQSGTVWLGDGTSTGGTFSIASGAVLALYYGSTTWDSASTISGAGTLTVQNNSHAFAGTVSSKLNLLGGTFSINSGSAQSVPSLAMAGGTLGGSGNVNVTGPTMTWGGGTLSGSGTLTVSAASAVTMSGYTYYDGKPIVNNGTITISGIVANYLQNGASLTNNGTVTFDNDGAIGFNGGAACSIVNNGTFAKDGGSSTSSVTVPFTNAGGGTIRAARSLLYFTSGLTQSGTLYFPISSQTLFGRIQVAGAFALGGTLTANTISYTPSNGTAFQVLTFGSSSGAFANKNLDYSAGTFTETYAPTTLTLTAGPPSLTVTGVTPSRGGIAGGTVVAIAGTNFASGATVTFGGNPAANVVFNNSTSLTATTPAHAVGLADVTVTNPSTQAATLQNGFTYTGLVSHYTFDVAGNPGKDVVSANDATSTAVSQNPGKVANGGTFASGFMDLPAAASLNVRSGDFTLSAFVKSSSTTNANWFTKAAAGPAHQYGLGTAGSTKGVFSFDGGAGGSVTSTSNIFDGAWHHVAGIKRGNAIEIWVDGRLEASGAVSGTADSGAFSIGRDGPNCCETFNGQLDEARIYNYALTSSEVIADALATDLVVVKSAPPSATVGQGMNYAITVTNNGPISATNVVLTDALPAGVSFVSDNTSQGSCSGSSTVTCNLGTLGNGASANVSIFVTATATGTITNTAGVTATEPDPTPGDASSSASTIVSNLTCAAPTISANGPTSFCPGGSVVLTANASSPTAYQWFLGNVTINGATNANYTATVSGSYTVRVTYASSCTNTSAATTVTVFAPPSAVISAPTSACPNANVTASVPFTSGATYNWTVTNAAISNGQGTDVLNFTPNGSGNVALTVDVTDANGCSATGNATVTTTSFVPTITPPGPIAFCAGGSVTLTASAGSTYLWSNGAHTQSITVTTSGNYSVTVNNGSCSGTSNPVTVTVGQPPAAAISASGPTTFCAPGSVTLTASPAGGSYSWSNGATTQSITVVGSGNYSVTVTVSGCSATSAAQTVTVNPAPIVSITGPSTFCAGTPITLDAGPGFVAYQWSNGATTQTITDTPSATTTYSVTVSNGTCSGSASKTVTLGGSPSPVITAAAAVCAGSTNNSAGVSAVSGATYNWTIANGTITAGQGTNSIQFTPGPSGNVTFGITVSGGSCSGSSSKTVAIQAPPAVTITGPTSTCPNVSFTLDAGAGFAAYAWSNGATTRTITVSQTATTTYSVNVTTSAGCSASASQTVSMASSGSVTISAPASVIASSAGHAASAPAGPAGTTYSWSVTNGTITSGQGTNAIQFTAGPSGTLTLSLSTNNGGCVSAGSASITITAAANLSISISAPSSVSAGAPLTYVVNISNAGPSTAQNVNVSNTLPSGVAFSSAAGTGWTCAPNGNTVNCSAPAVPVGNATPITINATAPNAAGNVADSATVSSSTPDPNPGNNAASAATSVTASTPQCPSAPPSLLIPANNATAVPNPVAFSWTAVPNATAYDLFVNGAAASSNTTTTATLGLPAGPATWFVVARFASCPPLFSETLGFTVAASNNCGAHAVPQLIGATPNGSNVAFQWTAVPEAVNYRLWIAVDGAAAQDAGTTGGALTLTIPVSGTNVSWFVEALFNGCPSTKSDTASFTLAKNDPCANHSAATLTAPANNATSTSSAVTFAWNAAAGASGYRLFASIDGAPFAALGTTSDTTLGATLTNGAVEWYVQTLFDGCPSLDSTHFTFTIPKAPNCPSTGAAPQSPVSVTLDKSPVTFAWSAAPNAIRYELWLSLDHAAPALIGTTTGATTLQHDVAAGALEWYVVTRFNGCPGVESAHASFTFAPPPNCPTGTSILTVPGDNTSVTGPVDFHWSAVPGATQYEVFAARNGSAPSSLGTTPGLHIDAQTLKDGAWSWTVVAGFGAGCSTTQSAPGLFTVLAPPPPCAPPAVPVVRAGTNASSNVVYAIRWNAVGNAGFYEIQQSASPDFSGAETEAVYGTEKSYQHVNNTASPVLFYYRVRAAGSCDATVKSLFSPVIAIAILPTQTTNAATPADDPQNVSYTLNVPTSAGLPFSASGNEPWVTVTPSSGTTTGNTLTLTVTANTAALPPGTSTAAVSVQFGSPSRFGANATSTSTTVNVNLTQPVSPGTKNTPPPDALIIPAVAHAGGINSNFQSDVRITNTAPQTQKYQLTFTPDDGAPKSTTIAIDPGKTLALDDLLATWFGNGTSAIGTLEIRKMSASSTTTSPTSTSTPSVTTFASSRTYNVTANGTFGQYIPAIPFAQFIDKSGLISLQQVASSAAFRTNLGLLEASGDPATVLVSVFGNDGSKLTEFTQTLAGGQHLQMNGILSTKGITDLADGRIEVKLTSSGGKVTAYASVLDNKTNDPLLVTPVSVTTTGAAKYVLPGIADLNNGVANWRSDVRIFNPGPADVKATATFYPLGGGDPISKQITIAAHQVDQIDAALETLFGLTNAGGALHITTENNAPLVATARTYNQTANGTFGQFIPAVTANDAVGKGGRALQILQVEESDRFRSNIGVTEVTGKPAKVEITAIPPDSKFAVTGTFDFAPNEYRQYSSLLKSLGLETAYNTRVTVRVIDGDGKVSAYASVVDMQTQDPNYVQAQ